MDKLSIVIPTMQKNVDVLNKLIDELNEDNSVDEIIVIDNSTKGFTYNSEKVRVILPKQNLFVNPSWNLGVKEAKNNYVGILNDDLIFQKDYCSQVLNFLQSNENIGLVGMDSSLVINSLPTEFNEYPENKEISFVEINDSYDTGFWGSTVFGKKENYYEIPNEMKIWCGDNYLIEMNKKKGKQNYQVVNCGVKHLISLTATASSSCIRQILAEDVRFYSKMDSRFKNHILLKEQRSIKNLLKRIFRR